MAMNKVSPKVAETARQERAQGGQPQASSSGDPNVNAAGPHDKAEHANPVATKGGGMLPTPGEASDDDMAPGG
jgi:hypothetical protein